MTGIKKTKIGNYQLPSIDLASGKQKPVGFEIEDYSELNNEKNEIYKQDHLIQDKIMPGGLAITGFNSAAFTVAPYEYAKHTGTNLTSVSQLLPSQITSAKAGKAISLIDDMYAEGIKGANQFYNAGNFAASANFGEAAFAEAAGQTAATIANPKNVLKATVAIPNVAGAAIGGTIDTVSTGIHYYEEGGMDEVANHKGELGGRFVGSTTGALIGTAAATGVGAIVGGMATGATVGAAAGSVVPVAGNVVGAIVGCVVGAIASTLLGDLGAELGANIFDNGGN